MSKNQKKLLVWFTPLLVVAIAVWLVVAKISPKSQAVYPEGTKILAHQNLPDYFPDSLIFENQKPLQISEVIYPDGSKEASLYYYSTTSLASLLLKYTKFLQEHAWAIQSPQLTENVGSIFAVKESAQIVLTLVKQSSDTKVSIVYKQ